MKKFNQRGLLKKFSSIRCNDKELIKGLKKVFWTVESFLLSLRRKSGEIWLLATTRKNAKTAQTVIYQ